jgi:phosphatidylglycerophosphatase A
VIDLSSSGLVRRPSWRFVFRHPARFIAFGGGAGLLPGAPGTFGTLLALPLYWLVAPRLAPVEYLLLVAGLFALGVWACEVTGRELGAADHGGMVWDEVVAFLLVLAIAPQDPWWQAAAFFLFRAFDVVKPPPIRRLERRFKGGFGVMFDDILAAGYALLVLALAKRFLFP